MIVLDVLHDKHITLHLSSKKKNGRKDKLELELLILHNNIIVQVQDPLCL